MWRAVYPEQECPGSMASCSSWSTQGRALNWHCDFVGCQATMCNCEAGKRTRSKDLQSSRVSAYFAARRIDRMGLRSIHRRVLRGKYKSSRARTFSVAAILSDQRIVVPFIRPEAIRSSHAGRRRIHTLRGEAWLQWGSRRRSDHDQCGAGLVRRKL